MNYVPITETFIKNYLQNPNQPTLYNLYHGDKEYHLYKDKNEIALYNDKLQRLFLPLPLDHVTPYDILIQLNNLGITHTTNPLLSDSAQGGKKRSNSRVRRKRSQKRKKYKRRHHTYRKSKTKV